MPLVPLLIPAHDPDRHHVVGVKVRSCQRRSGNSPEVLPTANSSNHSPGQCPKLITQHVNPKTAAPWVDFAQDLVAGPKEKSGLKNYSRTTPDRSDGCQTQIKAPATITSIKGFGARATVVAPVSRF